MIYIGLYSINIPLPLVIIISYSAIVITLYGIWLLEEILWVIWLYWLDNFHFVIGKIGFPTWHYRSWFIIWPKVNCCFTFQPVQFCKCAKFSQPFEVLDQEKKKRKKKTDHFRKTAILVSLENSSGGLRKKLTVTWFFSSTKSKIRDA